MRIRSADLSEHVRAMMAKPAAPKPANPGGMNKWEAAYARVLDSNLRAGVIRAWWFEAVKFRLANRCWYCPDFLVQWADGRFELHEVKGFWRDDAKVKVKVMAELFPFPLVIVCKSKDRPGGWSYERAAARQVREQ